MNSKIVPEPGGSAAKIHHLVAAHLAAILLDFARGAVVTLTGVLVGRVLVHAWGGGWAISGPASLGLLLVGGAVSVGILLRDLGGSAGVRRCSWWGPLLGLLGVRFL